MSEGWTVEGSGLIDLRALRASLAEAAAGHDARDEIAAVVTERSALVPVEVPPVPGLVGMPRAAPRRTIAVAASVATLVVSMVAFAAVPSWRPGAPRAESVPVVVESERVVRPLRIDPVPDPVPELEPEPVPEVARPVPRAPAPRERPHVSRVPDAPAHVTPARPAPVPAATPSSIDPALAAAVDAALSGGRATVATESLPLTPPQQEVRATLRGLERAVAMCREGEGGLAEVRLVIEGASGRVVSVDVRGDAARGAVASCIEDVVGDAQFSRFSRDRFAVTYPFRI